MKINFIKFNTITAPFYKKPTGVQQFAYNNFLQLNNNINQDTVEISFNAKKRADKIKEPYCSSDNFQIKKIANLRCPVCGKIMLNSNQIDIFVKDISTKKGKDLIKTLKKYENEKVLTKKITQKNKSIYRPIEQEAVNILKRLAKIYPQKDIYELAQIKKFDSVSKLIPLQMQVVEELLGYVEKNVEGADEKEKLKKLIEEYKDQIYGNSPIQFARKNFIRDTVNSFSNKKEQLEVNSIVQKLPTSQNNVDAFFVKYASETRNTEEFAKKLVERSTPSAEHIKPKSKGGKDTISNFLADCSDCNFLRRNIDFSQWAKTIPDFKKNLQSYLEDIQIALDKGLLDKDYDEYIPSIIATIENLSDGEISLELTDTKNLTTQEEIFAKRKAKVEKIKQDLDNLKAKSQEMLDEITEIEKSDEYEVFNQYAITKSAISRMESSIENLKQRKTNLKDKIANLIKKNDRDANITGRRKNIALKVSEYKTRLGQCEKQLKSELNTLPILKRKKELLEGKLPVVADIESQIKELSTKIKILGKIKSEYAQSEKILEAKQEVSAKYEELSSIINKAQEQNKTIEQNEGFDKTDKKDYEKYKHVVELINEAEKVRLKEENKKIPNNLRREIYDIALEALQKTLNELEMLDSVIYFKNIDTINDNQKEYSKIAKSRDEILKAEKRIEELNQNAYINQVGSIDELEAKLSELQDKKTLLSKIKNLNSLRKNQQILADIYKYKSEIYEQLKDYTKLSNEEYKQLVEQIASYDYYTEALL